MLRNWMPLGLSTFAVLFLVTRTPAGGQPTDGPNPQTDALKKLQAQVQAMDQALREVANVLNRETKKIADVIKAHDARLEKLEKRVYSANVSLYPPPGAKASLEQVQVPQTDAFKKLNERVQAMDQALRKMTDVLSREAKKGEDVIKALDKRLETIEKNDAFTRLKVSEVEIKIGTLNRQVEKMRLDMETLQKRTANIALYPPSDKASLDEIRGQLKQIEQTLNRIPTTPRVAFSPPTPRTGRIVLANSYPDTYLLFLINDRSYRVAAGQAATIDNMPAGSFTYEVISPIAGSGGRYTRVLEPGETYTLTAHP